jgi:hypothetical protein
VSASTLCLQLTNNVTQLLAGLLLGAPQLAQACGVTAATTAWTCVSNLGETAQLAANAAGAALPFGRAPRKVNFLHLPFPSA